MRHYCLPCTVAVLAGRVFVTARKTLLIALSRSFDGMGASQLRTVARAVALTTVTEAADKYRRATAGAKIVSCVRFHRQ